MRWIKIMLVLLLLTTTIVLGATPTPVPTSNPTITPQPVLTPQTDTSQLVIQKIELESKETRQFFATELQKNNAYFLSEFTKRADYYERAYQDILNNAVMKLGVFWCGIFLTLTCLQMMLNYWAEKRRYAVLLKALKLDTVRQIKQEYVMIPDKEIKFLNDYLIESKRLMKGEPKPSFFKRLFAKKEKKVMVFKEESKLPKEPQYKPEINNEALLQIIAEMKSKEAKRGLSLWEKWTQKNPQPIPQPVPIPTPQPNPIQQVADELKEDLLTKMGRSE